MVIAFYINLGYLELSSLLIEYPKWRLRGNGLSYVLKSMVKLVWDTNLAFWNGTICQGIIHSQREDGGKVMAESIWRFWFLRRKGIGNLILVWIKVQMVDMAYFPIPIL